MTNNLKHYGIKGMQWGVRRKRSSKTGRVESEDSRSAKSLRKKKLSEMSNDELRKLNTRLQLERQYKDLTKKDTSKAQKFVSDVLRESGKNLASKYVKDAGETVINNLINVAKESKTNPSPTVPFRSTSSIKIKKKP